jgi:aryl-alcohol dehydrogenase-like predicted oxidoreductase
MELARSEEKSAMEYRRLGQSGLKVSVVGLGGNNFGGAADEERSISVIRRALDIGVNTIDTADGYSAGVSEQFVGKAIAGRRQEAIVATKVFGKMGPGPNDQGLSRKHIMDGCEQSLRRLNTDYIDLYQVHRFDPETPLEETLRTLDDLVRAGKVRYIGCSNFAAWQLTQALWISAQKGLAAFVSVQPQYSMVARDVERELLPACSAFGVGIIPYSPLAGGVLTGKYEAGKAPPPDTRAGRNTRMQQQLTPERLGTVDKLNSFARERGYGVTQLAIAWLAAHPEVSTVIAGATRPEQVDDNAKAADVKLTSEDMQSIEGILKG